MSITRRNFFRVSAGTAAGTALGGLTALGADLTPKVVLAQEARIAQAKEYPSVPANARHFEEWRSRATSFAALAALDWRTTSLTGAGDPAQVAIVRASGTAFDVLQMPVAFGRALTRDDERPDRPPVAVVAHGLWQDRLGGDPQVLGRSLVLGGTQYTIVGVLPRGAELPTFPVLSESASLSSAFAAIVPLRLNLAAIGWMGTFNYPVVARLKAGVTVAQARAELDVIQRAVAEIAARETHEPAELRGWIVPLEESQRMVDALKKIGVPDVKLTVFPEAGHDSWTEAYNNPELYDWLLKHRR